MYAQYWGLSETPFANTVDARWFYESPTHEEALARLLFVVEQRRGCGVLYGPAGGGKTLLLQVLTRELRRQRCCLAPVDLLGRSGVEILTELAAQLGLAPGYNDSEIVLWRRIDDHLRGSQAAKLQTVILFDHFERAREHRGYLDRLLNIRSGAASLTTILVAVRSESLPQFAGTLTELSDIRTELHPFSRLESRRYVERLLESAGAHGPLFDAAALDRLHDVSRGIPRQLNRLCDLALLGAMADGEHHVGERYITGAAEDLRALSATAVDVPLAVQRV